jgi:hypothetical protein
LNLLFAVEKQVEEEEAGLLQLFEVCRSETRWAWEVVGEPSIEEIERRRTLETLGMVLRR